MTHHRQGALVGAAAVLSLAVGAPLALAAQVAVPLSTSTSVNAAPAAAGGAQVTGLLDPIGGLLGGVLGTVSGTLSGLLGATQVSALQGVTTSLTGGAAPSATTLAPLTGWLSQISGNAVLPAELRTTSAQVAGLLASPGTPDAPLSVPSLASVTGLLTQLQGTAGLAALNPTGVSALTGLISALTASATAASTGTGGAPAGLPILGALPIVGTLPIGDGLLAPLESLVGTLTGGTAATGALLSPVTGLLRQIAALPGLDSLVGSTLTQLADQVDAQGGILSGDLLGTLTSTLQSLVATPGVPAPLAGLVGSLTGLLGSSVGAPVTPVTPKPGPSTTGTPGPRAASPTAAAVGTARIWSARVDRKLGTVRVALACPATGPACKTLVAAYRGKVLEASTALLTIPAGATVKRSLKLDAATRRLIKRKTTTFTLSAVLPGGKVSKKTVKATLPKAAKK
ncbi:MAG: hypothetical protein JWO02_4508 [Solirubrobacterales bacterium]|nr:hypothetical protein [Solirubrobacterales bacterium]